MSNLMTVTIRDYQKFDISERGIENIGDRLKAKLQAIPLPDLSGKSVLDIGCDMGFWTFYAATHGAKSVLGLDRNRPVNGEYADLIAQNRGVVERFESLKSCSFHYIDIGRQWKEYGKHDVIFLFSLYHHIFQNCGNHDSIWLWLWRHCHEGSVVLWENPVDLYDGVADSHVQGDKRKLYTRSDILTSAAKYFIAEYIGPAIHEPNRHVYRFTPRIDIVKKYHGAIEAGAGGAATAFQYAKDRRSKEIEGFLGFYPYPGSLNIKLKTPFDFEGKYYYTKILDVKDRSRGFDSWWETRQCRFYPVTIEGLPCYVMRFEDESYDANFIEIISDFRLRDKIAGNEVTIEK